MEIIKKKLHTALKLSGFSVRKEFCSLIVDKFEEQTIDLQNNRTFESCVKNICASLENQCLSQHSIEKEHVDRALEVCLHSGYDKNETVFNVIGAFDFPWLCYDPDRRQHFIDNKTSKPRILSGADSKAQLHLDRYNSILQRTRRNFQQKSAEAAGLVQLKLQTVDYLLTLSYVSLDNILILGSLLQTSEGKYSLEDPTGIIQLDLSHANNRALINQGYSHIRTLKNVKNALRILWLLMFLVFFNGFFVENSFVLVNGQYEDKLLKVSTVVLPPGELYRESRSCFNNLNYFGGPSPYLLRDSVKLKEHLQSNKNDMMMFFSDVWLDHPQVFEKLEVLFEGINANPPIAFVFMGNFLSESFGSDRIDVLKKQFKHFGELVAKYPNLTNQSNFVFVPGPEDPCISHIVPKSALPTCITEEMTKICDRAIFTTNPCRIQYCTKEIVVFRADLLPKLLQGTLFKPNKDEISNCLTKTLISQGHLSPLSLNALTVHWDFDYTLRLYPLPDLVVVGDKSENYKGKYKECQVVNPGSFCDSGFQFKAYVPATDSIDECIL